MTVDEQIKLALGNYVFQCIVLSSQLEEAKKRIGELEEKAKVNGGGN